MEELPPNMPKPRGRQVSTTAFVDASHAANRVSRKSHSSYVILSYGLVKGRIPSSQVSSEFIAAKTCVEQISALRYKLRMFGVPIDGPTNILCDNESVVKNSTRIDYSLN